MNRVLIQRRVPPAGIPSAASLRRFVDAAAQGRPGTVTLRLVDRDEARELNRSYRGRDYATNVLSFPAEALPLPLPEDEAELGDIVICAPVVADEAREQHKPARAHWAHMVIHGTLHLLGLDHQTDPDAERMEARERQILAGFGIADPYADRQSTNSPTDSSTPGVSAGNTAKT